MSGEIHRHCLIPDKVKDGKTLYKPAKLFRKDLDAAIDTLAHVTEERLPERRINRAEILMDEFCEVGDEADGEFVANWFLEEWGAVANTDQDRELIRELTIRMGVNILDRIERPGGGLKMWPVLVGKPNLGKSLFTQNILPISMMNVGLHGGILPLDRSRNDIILKVAGELVCEIPELAGVQNRDSEELKYILSMTRPPARPLYRSSRIYTMTCAFIGTANPDRPLLPSVDRGLALRLPVIVITDSPWRESRIDDVMNADGEELKKRLWRGWKYWHSVKGVDPVRSLPEEMEDLICRRALPFTYVNPLVSEHLEIVKRLVRHNLESSPGPSLDDEPDAGLKNVGYTMLSEGLLSADMINAMERAGFRQGGVTGNALGNQLNVNEEWIKVDDNPRKARWANANICLEYADLVPKGGPTDKAMAKHGYPLPENRDAPDHRPAEIRKVRTREAVAADGDADGYLDFLDNG